MAKRQLGELKNKEFYVWFKDSIKPFREPETTEPSPFEGIGTGSFGGGATTPGQNRVPSPKFDDILKDSNPSGGTPPAEKPSDEAEKNSGAAEKNSGQPENK